MTEQEQLFAEISILIQRVYRGASGDPFLFAFKKDARQSFYDTNWRLLERVKSNGQIAQEDLAQLLQSVNELLKPENRASPEEAETSYFESLGGPEVQPWDLQGDWRALRDKILSTNRA